MDKLEKLNRIMVALFAIIQIICFLGVSASPFIWIWYSWDLAWKVGLSGIIGTLIITFIYKMLVSIYISTQPIIKKNKPEKIENFQTLIDQIYNSKN